MRSISAWWRAVLSTCRTGVATGSGDVVSSAAGEGVGSAPGEGSPDGDGDADGSGELKGVDSGDGDGEGDGDAEGVGEGVCCGEAKDPWRLKEVVSANETKIARHRNKNGETIMLILKRIFPMKNEL
ncbi:MAG TPA: hypothetical protein VFH31_15900 [Pyrinomonadaceae bacterium]|nr:hypothetical protein [Pyrinomonadaceae bacterium]